MATRFRASLLVTLTLIAISSSTHALAGIKLEFIGEATFPTGFRFEDTEVGGLSGID